MRSEALSDAPAGCIKPAIFGDFLDGLKDRHVMMLYHGVMGPNQISMAHELFDAYDNAAFFPGWRESSWSSAPG